MQTLGISSGMCWFVKLAVCMQIVPDKGAHLGLHGPLCSSLLMRKNRCQQSDQEQKGVFKTFPSTCSYSGPHGRRPGCIQTSQDKSRYHSYFTQQAPTPTAISSRNNSQCQMCTTRFYLHAEIFLHFPKSCH